MLYSSVKLYGDTNSYYPFFLPMRYQMRNLRLVGPAFKNIGIV